jgi:hypothetical protein
MVRLNNNHLAIKMNDVLITKTIQALSASFSDTRPSVNSTNFYIQSNGSKIPIWGYRVYSTYPTNGLFVVLTRTKSGDSYINANLTDDVYYSSTPFTI